MKKETVMGATNATMGGMSVISSYNVCHSLCIGVIALLSFFGIIVAGFPLAFLIPYQIYFWIFGILILIIALALYKIKGPCISKHIILANFGLLFAGIPFLQNYSLLFLIIGFTIAISAIALYFAARKKNGK